ncbi:hypothetical protein [Actinomycetospora soli]|uniref:hypothetical protein n=1 Tax=Actinomycetospora soli TaxID=2893887 RepID=UPI001E5EFE84|nr:hypothetical protein [Actinomycetospora soli]MCD2186961.1 hypothetical protein [Actinomycetospora soli]
MSVHPFPTHAPRPPATGTGLAPLRRTVTAAIAMLGDLRTLHPAVTTGHLERHLRAEVERALRGPDGGCSAIPAVSTACAHLATRSYEDAYLALVTATGLLPRPSA